MSPLLAASRPSNASKPLDEKAAVLTRAVLRAADWLGLSGRQLASVLGVGEASVSRMRHGALTLDAGSKAFELGVLFVRMFRALDAIVGGDQGVARAWLRAHNSALVGEPLAKMSTIVGLLDVIAYLDARSAVV